MGRRKGSVNKVDQANLPRGVTFLKDGRARPFVVRHRALKAEAFASAEAAVARKKELVALESRQGVEALTYSRAVHADVTAARDLLPEGVSHTEAARFWLLHHPEQTITVAEGVERFLRLRREQSIHPEGSTRHTKDLASRLGRFVLHFGRQALPDVTGEAILMWLTQLSGPDGSALGARSVANYRGALDNFFNYAARRRWVAQSPMKGVIQEDLPTVRRSPKNPLLVDQANGVLALIEAVEPRFLVHFALRLFLGMRTEESQRFRWEWIQRAQGRIVVPGWFYREGDTLGRGSKTGDDWAIDDIAPRFWQLYDAEPRPASGTVPRPSNKYWHGDDARTRQRCLKRQVLDAIGLDTWPHNTMRDTFCTLHMSAYRDAQRTALVLKHRNSQTLWQSYLGTLTDQASAQKFFEG